MRQGSLYLGLDLSKANTGMSLMDSETDVLWYWTFQLSGCSVAIVNPARVKRAFSVPCRVKSKNPENTPKKQVGRIVKRITTVTKVKCAPRPWGAMTESEQEAVLDATAVCIAGQRDLKVGLANVADPAWRSETWEATKSTS
ncbi:MAG: hypothetical protein KAW17_09590 [Candidatus Eisenbacteria sp.]|nr:hypothetical protein [Candidatus Eisenbacteria bacterium]